MNNLGEILPRNYKTSFLGDKLNRFAGRLNSVIDEDDLYFNLVSEWNSPKDVVLDAEEPGTILKDKSSWPSLDSFQERMMFLDSMTYLPDDILVKVDRAAMGVSLETRAPFLDHRVVELSTRIPIDFKINNGVGKKILRNILYRYVPRELIERPKHGFGIPLGDWLRGPLKEWAEEYLNENRIEQEGFFNSKKIRTRWEEHISKKRNWEHSIWSILMFESWLDSN